MCTPCLSAPSFSGVVLSFDTKAWLPLNINIDLSKVNALSAPFLVEKLWKADHEFLDTLIAQKYPPNATDDDPDVEDLGSDKPDETDEAQFTSVLTAVLDMVYQKFRAALQPPATVQALQSLGEAAVKVVNSKRDQKVAGAEFIDKYWNLICDAADSISTKAKHAKKLLATCMFAPLPLNKPLKYYL